MTGNISVAHINNSVSIIRKLCAYYTCVGTSKFYRFGCASCNNGTYIERIQSQIDKRFYRFSSCENSVNNLLEYAIIRVVQVITKIVDRTYIEHIATVENTCACYCGNSKFDLVRVNIWVGYTVIPVRVGNSRTRYVNVLSEYRTPIDRCTIGKVLIIIEFYRHQCHKVICDYTCMLCRSIIAKLCKRYIPNRRNICSLIERCRGYCKIFAKRHSQSSCIITRCVSVGKVPLCNSGHCKMGIILCQIRNYIVIVISCDR